MDRRSVLDGCVVGRGVVCLLCGMAGRPDLELGDLPVASQEEVPGGTVSSKQTSSQTTWETVAVRF